MKQIPIARHPSMLLLSVALLLMLAGTVRGQADAQDDSAPAVEPRQRVIVYFGVGHSSSDSSQRRIGYGVARGGWDAFVRRRIQPFLDRGFRRVEIHNPFGTLTGEAMQFDQAVHADEGIPGKHPRLGKVLTDFVEAWRPVTSGERTGGEPVEVIAYLGTLDKDPDFESLRESHDTQAYLRRAHLSTGLPLAAGMSIGIDSMGGRDAPAEDHPSVRYAMLMRALGVRMYIEPCPPKNATYLHDFNLITTVDFWFKTRHYGWAANRQQINGEVIVLLGHVPRNQMMRVAKRCLAEGLTVAITSHKLDPEQWDELLEISRRMNEAGDINFD